jgi:hypothetical protein
MNILGVLDIECAAKAKSMNCDSCSEEAIRAIKAPME